ncbi:hypothetical protein [Ulvibacterium sp.]|uniref:hypothetical protein n=1 Tax=Ulvibacterium sp. TaxID=2665914 RepID=UPI0026161FF0|nr:hypothetical protein [Ulvibacterium sp.]
MKKTNQFKVALLSTLGTMFLGITCALCQAQEKNEAATREFEFKKFSAFNGIEMEYTVLVPDNYDDQKGSPGLVSFGSMKYDKDIAQWTISNIWSDYKKGDHIVVIPIAPKNGRNGWINHPTHHALNDLLKHVKKSYFIKNGTFVAFGYKDGSVAAQTYIEMSSDYFKSLIVCSSHYWDHYDSKAFDKLQRLAIPITIICGQRDSEAFTHLEKIDRALKNREVDYKIVVLEDNDRNLEAIQNGKVAQYIR